MLAEYRKRENYDWAFRSTLEDLVGKVDFSWVKSCVSFGTGTGEHEIEFVRRFMPNLKTFIAVEPDQESVKTLRRNFQNAQLPGKICLNPLKGTSKQQSNGPLYSDTVIGTLAVDGWAVTFGTARRGLGGLGPPVLSSLYQM